MDVYGHLKIPVTGSFCKSTSDYGNHNKYLVISINFGFISKWNIYKLIKIYIQSIILQRFFKKGVLGQTFWY